MSVNHQKKRTKLISLHNPPSKLKTYGFASAIIIGVGCIAVSLVGFGHFYLGGNFNQISYIPAALILIAVGLMGIILSITGIVGLLKK